MPFTFAHPSVVLPFLKKKHRYLSATGLVIGSLTPDFFGFFRLDVQKQYSHSIPGMFLLDVPMAIVVAYAFHYIIRQPLIGNLPVFLNKRLARFLQFSWHPWFLCHWWVVLLSMLAGIFSHLLLDDLTHINVVNTKCAICILLNNDMTTLLQSAVTVLGLTYISIFILSLPAGTPAGVYKNRLFYWAAIVGGCIGVLEIFSLIRPVAPHGGSKSLVNDSMAAFLLCIILTSLCYKAFFRPEKY